MHKRIIAVVGVVIWILIATLSFTGCGNQTATCREYQYAIIYLPDGVIIEGEVSGWNHWEDTDMLQITIDSITYLTHSSNVILISE